MYVETVNDGPRRWVHFHLREGDDAADLVREMQAAEDLHRADDFVHVGTTHSAQPYSLVGHGADAGEYSGSFTMRLEKLRGAA